METTTDTTQHNTTRQINAVSDTRQKGDRVRASVCARARPQAAEAQADICVLGMVVSERWTYCVAILG